MLRGCDVRSENEIQMNGIQNENLVNAIVKDAHVQFIMFECYAEQTTLKKERRILKMISTNPKSKSYLTELRFMAKSYPTSTLNKQEAGAQEG